MKKNFNFLPKQYMNSNTLQTVKITNNRETNL